MKKYILIFLLLFFLSHIFSQSYFSFFADTTQYNLTNIIWCKKNLKSDAFAPCVVTNEYFLLQSNQLTYNGKTYFIPQVLNGELFTPGNLNSEGLLIREDTTLGRIYRYFPSINNELIICDMSLNKGDTFQFYSFINESSYSENFYAEEGIKLVVDTVTYINGKKVIHFPNVSSSSFFNGSFWTYGISIKFIEGIGPTYGPFGFINVIGFENRLPLLLCNKKNNQLEYMQHSDLTCNQNSVNIEEVELPQISIFPNPTSNVIHINLNSNKDEFFLNICNIYGSIVHSENVSENTIIDVKDLPSGIYLLNFKSNQFLQFSKKIIICK